MGYLQEMDTVTSQAAGRGVVWDLARPREQALPAVFASPHSGNRYPSAFVASARLDALSLRKSEDCFVDEIFAGVAEEGAPLLKALFPRAYLDPNREPFELDPAMFGDALPAYANTRSPRVAAGLGTIARVVANGEEIYRAKLSFAEALERVEALYRPYHAVLESLVEGTVERFGYAMLIDCHSMPSIGGPMDEDAGRRRDDIVLGDCHGTSCAAPLTALVERFLVELGYQVGRNIPYAGGFTTRHYGRPRASVHALQIEINRALYMDEATLERGPGLPRLMRDMRNLAHHLRLRLPALLRAA
ncbi:MAG TPA: N-formylglutamate amidohydrolase [Alphaproteobacteria bacterium]|nr:N-formylglutamate amidohydrolase [Alphaproteobacteria bacterium]